MNDVRDAIASIVKDVRQSPVSGADEEKPLKDIGIDSLDVANILLAVEERFDLKISDADAERLDTLAAIARYVESRGAAKDAAHR